MSENGKPNGKSSFYMDRFFGKDPLGTEENPKEKKEETKTEKEEVAEKRKVRSGITIPLELYSQFVQMKTVQHCFASDVWNDKLPAFYNEEGKVFSLTEEDCQKWKKAIKESVDNRKMALVVSEKYFMAAKLTALQYHCSMSAVFSALVEKICKDSK